MPQRYRLAAVLLALSLTACGGSAPSYNNQAEINNMAAADDLTDIMPLTDDQAPSNDLSNQANAVEPAACATPPANGALLDGRRFSGEGHELQIHNGASGDAIIKIRNAETGRLVTSFFVTESNSASVSGIPDGTYTFQYAFGAPLAEDCKSFVNITSANEFPGPRSLVTEESEDGRHYTTRQLSYTLYSVPEGNIQPVSIDPAAFNRN